MQKSASGSRTWFFLGLGVLMAISVFVGFAPTFYLRSFLGTNDRIGSLPPYLIVHGIVLTSWFLLFLIQTVLVATGATGIHRRLGVPVALLGVGVVVTGGLATMRAIPRLPGGIVIGNLVGLVMFCIFVLTGIYFRRQPMVHKRAMLLASINLIGPAFSPARAIGRAVSFPLFPLALGGPLVALVIHDLVVYRRLQSETIWTSLLMMAGFTLFAVLLFSGAGLTIVHWLA